MVNRMVNSVTTPACSKPYMERKVKTKMKCRCGGLLHMSAGASIRDGVYRWHASYHCSQCGQETEVDGTGIGLPPEIQDSITAFEGVWEVKAGEGHAASASYLLGKILKDCQLPGITRDSGNSGMVYYGTRNQALWLKDKMIQSGMAEQDLICQEAVCEHVLGPEDIKTWLGSRYDAVHHLTGKVLLTKWPSSKAEGLLKIKKTFKLQASASVLLKAGLPYIITDRLIQWDALERMEETGCPECLEFVCDTQVADGKGYFSFKEVMIRYAGEETGIKRCDFHNTVECRIATEEQALERARSECTIGYTDTRVYRDFTDQMWLVLFFTASALGGCQEVYMDSSGITRLIVYGE